MRMTIFTLFSGLVFVVGVCSQDRLATFNNPNAVAAQGQAEIIINAENAQRDMVVWINGILVAHLAPGTQEKIIVINGRHMVEAAESTARFGQWNISRKNQITVNSNSNRTVVDLDFRYRSFIGLSVQQIVPLSGALVSTGATALLENAVIRTVALLETSLPNGSIIAILSIASQDGDEAEFAIEALTFHMVNTGRFTVVERVNLDAIRAETQFQMSGEVDDNSAVDIGKMLGASIVITGNITRSGAIRRLSVRALDVLTARIEAMAREVF